nr:hypothetical protein [Tanacetum cinerariifolium]
MEAQPKITQNISSLKLPMLKARDYDLWTVGTVVPPKTKAQTLVRKNKLKAKSTLLLAIPDERLLKFHSIKDAKSFWDAIKISINETINAAPDIPTAGLKEQPSASSYADDVMFYFFASQSNTPQLDNKDLEQIDTDDLEEIDLKWQGNMSGGNERRVIPLEAPASALVVQDGLGGYDWSYQAEEGPINFTLMAHSSDSANSSNSEVQSCSNECLQSFKNLQKQYDQQKEILNKANIEILGYDSQLSKNELPTCEIFEAASDSSVNEIDEDNNQATDMYKVGIGYHAVPPPYTRNYMPPRADLSFAGLDDYVFKFKISETRTSESDSEDECEDKTSTAQDKSSNDNSVKSIECTKNISLKNTQIIMMKTLEKDGIIGLIGMVIITEDSIRSDLRFDDAEGTACLLNEAIFEGLAPMGAKTTAWNEFNSTMVSAIIYLADSQKFNFSNLQEYVLDLPDAKAAQEKEIAALKKKVIKLNKWRKSRSRGLKRLKKFSSGRRVKSPMEKNSLGAQEDASKHERMIEEIDQNAKIALDDETHRRTNNDEMFGVDDLVGEEVVIDTTTGVHEEQIIEDVSTAEPVTTAGEVVTTTTIKDSAAPTIDIEDEITMAQALVSLKSIKPKVVVQEQEMSTIIPAVATTVTTVVPTPRAKGKAKMIEPEVPIKKKDQMRIDEEYARKLEAEEQKAARLSSARQDEEANKSWDNIQDMVDADRLLAERLQAREMEEFSEVDENVEPVIDDTKELKKCIEIVHDDGDEEKRPISTNIRADGNSQVYQTFEKMFKNFNREDLEVLSAIVKDIFKKEKPIDDMDNLLFRTLKTMFEHHVEDNIWKYQH